MKKIYAAFYRMKQNDASISLEVANSVAVLPEPSSVSLSERGDVYVVTAPNGGFLANGTRSNLSDDWFGPNINAANIPTLVNSSIIGNNIVSTSSGASFTSKNILSSTTSKFSIVDVEVMYKPPALAVSGPAGNITLSGQPLTVGTKLLVTVNGVTYETTITTLGTSSASDSNWSSKTTNSLLNSNNWCKIIYDGIRYIILSGGGTLSESIATSLDGDSWTYTKLPFNLHYSSMAYSGSKYVAVAEGSNLGFVSTDLNTFTPTILPASKSWVSVIWTSTNFYALSQEGYTAASFDGVNWVGGNTNIVGKYAAVAFGAGLYVAVQGKGSVTKTYATSPDGINWTKRELPLLLDASNVVFINNKFFITAKGTNVLLYSSDGFTWTTSVLPKISDWMDIAFGVNEYLIISATSPLAPAYKSTDLISWTGEVVNSYATSDLFDLTSICYGGPAGFVAISKSYDRLLTRNIVISTTGSTYSPPIVGVPSSVVIGGQTAELSFIDGSTPPVLSPATIRYSAPDLNGVVTANFSLRGPATQFQFKFNMNMGDSVSRINYLLYEDGGSMPVQVLNPDALYSYVTDGVQWFLISVGLAPPFYTNPSQFPIPGDPSSTYLDTTTNITYRWNPLTNRYETIGDGRLWQYSNRATFPASGLEFHFYLDRSTGVEYYWDPVRAAYIAKGGGDTPIGTIHTLFGSTIPAGYLLANGSAFDTTTYPFLHAWLQAEFPGYISGTLPNLTNMHLRMTDGVRVIGDYQADAILQHSHSASISGGISCATVIGDDDGLYRGNRNFGFKTPTGDLGVSIGAVTGATTEVENRVKNKAVKFIIKAVNGHMDIGGIPAEKEIYFFATFANFPSPGVSGKIYIDQSNDKAYFWNGSYVSLGWSEKNAVNIVPVTSSPFNYTSGQFLDVQIPNAIINLPLLPSGQSIKISNSGAAHNTVINANINGATSNNSLINPYNKITLTALATEFRID